MSRVDVYALVCAVRDTTYINSCLHAYMHTCTPWLYIRGPALEHTPSVIRLAGNRMEPASSARLLFPWYRSRRCRKLAGRMDDNRVNGEGFREGKAFSRDAREREKESEASERE